MFTFMLIVINRKFAIRKFHSKNIRKIQFDQVPFRSISINYKDYHDHEKEETCPYYMQISS